MRKPWIPSRSCAPIPSGWFGSVHPFDAADIELCVAASTTWSSVRSHSDASPLQRRGAAPAGDAPAGPHGDQQRDHERGHPCPQSPADPSTHAATLSAPGRRVLRSRRTPRQDPGVMPAFVHRLRVRYHECDAQGVVFNAHYFAFFDITLTELWRAAFGSYAAMLEQGTDVVVAEASARFRAPARFDDELDIAMAVEHLGTTSMVSDLRVLRGDEELVQRAHGPRLRRGGEPRQAGDQPGGPRGARPVGA